MAKTDVKHGKETDFKAGDHCFIQQSENGMWVMWEAKGVSIIREFRYMWNAKAFAKRNGLVVDDVVPFVKEEA